jgi:[FeFe] hydrogenase H-cluster maturation GTPase HydF
MKKTPKSLRLQIGLFGRTNVGKSSFLNLVAGQDVAITSPVAGTTTDVVEKSMELLPLGPVVFLDTGGLDDRSVLAEARLKKTFKIFDRSDIITLVVEPNTWTDYEEKTLEEAKKREIPTILLVNKIDLGSPSTEFIGELHSKTSRVLLCSSVDFENRDPILNQYKKFLIEVCPDDFLKPPPLVGDLLPEAGLAVLIVPIDLQAPKGRLILPQVQTIREALDFEGRPGGTGPGGGGHRDPEARGSGPDRRGLQPSRHRRRHRASQNSSMDQAVRRRGPSDRCVFRTGLSGPSARI